MWKKSNQWLKFTPDMVLIHRFDYVGNNSDFSVSHCMSKPSPAYFWATDSPEVLALSCLRTYFCSSSFKVHDGEVQSHLSLASLTKPYRGPQVVWSVNIRLPSNTNFREIATLARYSATRHYTRQNFMKRKTLPFQRKTLLFQNINFQMTLHWEKKGKLLCSTCHPLSSPKAH